MDGNMNYFDDQWQYFQIPNVQHGNNTNTNGQGTVFNHDQYPGPQTQATTSTFNTITTTKESTVTSNLQTFNQPYASFDENQQYLASAGLQHSDQSHNAQNRTSSRTRRSESPNYLVEFKDCEGESIFVPHRLPRAQHAQESLASTSKAIQQQFSAPSAPFPGQSQHVMYQPQPVVQQPQIPQHAAVHQQQQMAGTFVPQPPQQPSNVDFTQLVQAPPQPIPGNDFRQLMQDAPPENASSNAHTTTTTTKRTETYKGANAGGEARKLAESEGVEEVQRFDKRVKKLVMDVGTCPRGTPWYNSETGYLCAEGIHFLYHKDIDRALKRPGWLPKVTWVNTRSDPEARASGTYTAMHPPPIAFGEPMHRVHAFFMNAARGSMCFKGLERDKAIKQGCTAACLGGIDSKPAAEANRYLRWQGFEPNATRHAMFE